MDERNTLTESEYRRQIQVIYDQIEKSLEGLDPDQVECDQSLGSLTLTFGKSSKCILSAQPSVQQLWLAMAAQGKAYHFNFSSEKKVWLDDRGQGIEILTLLQDFLNQTIGIQVRLRKEAKVEVFTTLHCPYCMKAKQLLKQRNVPFEEIQFSEDDDQKWDDLHRRSGMRTVPQIFHGEKLIGGYTDLEALDQKDQLRSLQT